MAFLLFVLAMLALDLGVFHRRAHAVHVREALAWSGFWITLALLFNLLIYFWQGKALALQFFTGYLIEKSLSIDNIFVFLLIFRYFRVPAAYQHRVLFWGILGALVMRGLFIAAGITLLERFHWMIYLFGVLLVYTGVRMAVEKDKELHPEENPVLRLFRRVVPVTPDYANGWFFVRREGRRWATPLMVVLLLVETTDLIFAVDSIPAILAVSTDPFIVYTSNVFAILGLRALYFALAGVMHRFAYLHYGLAVILVFVGAKMLMTDLYKIPVAIALLVVAGVLAATIIVSLLFPPRVVVPLSPVQEPS
jgi:tellurite resistance protein TerC